VFYIDVGNVPPEDVSNYLEQAQTSLKRNQIVDKTNGQVDLRYNPLSVDEDYFLPVRGGESGTRIDTLAGGQNTAAIEDVEYIQKKLFAALKVPRAYLGYDEEIGSKATLAQEDIRFSRAIQRIQKTVLSELNKIAMIHLYCHGYDGFELSDFELRLSNPSSVAQQQKLELIRARFEIAGAAPEGSVSRMWIQKNVLGLNDDEITDINKQREEDKLLDLTIEAIQPPADDAAAGDAGAGGGDAGAADAGADDAGAGGDEGGDEGGLFSADRPEGELLTAYPAEDREKSEDDDEAEESSRYSIDDIDAPIKAQNALHNIYGQVIQKDRKVRNGPGSTHMPNFVKMASVGKAARGQDTSNKPFGNEISKDPFREVASDPVVPRLTISLAKTLNHMSNTIGINKASILSEDLD
jgi:hypothetical protein